MAEDARELYEATTDRELAAELEKRGLAQTGTTPELVDRLLTHDAELEAAVPPPDAPPAAADGDLCLVCWPDGWPTPDTANASCEHGVWDR